MSAALAQAIQKTTEAFLKGYVDASHAKNPKILSAEATDDCVRYIGPPCFLRSVGAPADLSMNNTQYEDEFNTMEFYSLDQHEFYDMTIDAPNRKAAVRSELTGKFIDGKELLRTFVWFLDFTEDGSKIVKIYQHNDSEEGRNFRLAVAEYQAAKDRSGN
ncbi:hypothetical protein BP6252_11310 [Coleophoma cylindrospora]|uniref:SnoaL-like domain-containing protein n=1 Tax=Coleophoma cylindrospora TaxID=1849047 RepID=A0A3D8QPN4_9HELO|nr:hypothetical protein BP6252_11310 [Coleophoma cylindrospora]